MFVRSAVQVVLSFGSMPRRTHSSLDHSAARARVKHPVSFTYPFARKCSIWSARKRVHLYGVYVGQRKAYA